MTIGRIPSVEGGIQPTIVDAKGDILTATAADTPAVLAVGNNGDTLVADSSATTGLRWQGNYAAGKNKIINGDFGIWQRGTTFNSASTGQFIADRFFVAYDGSGATRNVSQQTFTPGTAPVAGYEGQYFVKWNQTVAGTSGTYNILVQRIEDVRTFAGQTITLSFWAKAAASATLGYQFSQIFGSGGSSSIFEINKTDNLSVTTSWQRFSATVTMPSISGKTIGTSSYIEFCIRLPLNSTFNVDIWGVQLEAGSTATAFQTATGTLAGELAACQRYYLRYSITAAPAYFLNGVARGGTIASCYFPAPEEMRIVPSSIDVSGFRIYNFSNGTAYTGGTTTLEAYNNKIFQVNYTHGSSVFTTGTNILGGLDATSSYIGFSAEL